MSSQAAHAHLEPPLPTPEAPQGAVDPEDVLGQPRFAAWSCVPNPQDMPGSSQAESRPLPPTPFYLQDVHSKHSPIKTW